MSLPIILALGGLVGFGLSNFFWKVAGINKVYPPSFMVVETLVVLTVAIAIHFFQNHTMPEFCDPTIVALKHTNLGYCTSIQNMFYPNFWE